MADLNAQRDQLRRRLLGWDIATHAVIPGADIGRDLELVSAPSLDLGRVIGLDNVAQALTHALTTRLGDDVFNVAYGFDGLNALAEEQDAFLARERIRVSMIAVLNRDPRVKRILDVQLGDRAGDSPGAFFDRRLDVTVAFETITGDSAGVELLKGAPRVG
jgi:hypothetical protein